MIEKAILRRTIKKSADGDFSKFMSQNSKDVTRVLNYAAKKANEDQLKLVQESKK